MSDPMLWIDVSMYYRNFKDVSDDVLVELLGNRSGGLLPFTDSFLGKFIRFLISTNVAPLIRNLQLTCSSWTEVSEIYDQRSFFDVIASSFTSLERLSIVSYDAVSPPSPWNVDCGFGAPFSVVLPSLKRLSLVACRVGPMLIKSIPTCFPSLLSLAIECLDTSNNVFERSISWGSSATHRLTFLDAVVDCAAQLQHLEVLSINGSALTLGGGGFGFGLGGAPAPLPYRDRQSYDAEVVGPLLKNHPTLRLFMWDQIGSYHPAGPNIPQIHGQEDQPPEITDEQIQPKEETKVIYLTHPLVQIGAHIPRELRYLAPYITSVNAQDMSGLSLLHACLVYMTGSAANEAVKMLIEQFGASLTFPTGCAMLSQMYIQVPAASTFEPEYPRLRMPNQILSDNDLSKRIFRNGYSPLMLAVLYEQDDILSYFLAKGAPVNQRAVVGGVTALHLAASHRNIPFVETLLDAGADPLAVDVGGWTALHFALAGGTAMATEVLNLVKLLVDRGISVNAVDSKGMSAISLAVLSCNVELCRLLVQLGAKPPASHEVLELLIVSDFAAQDPNRVNMMDWVRELHAQELDASRAVQALANTVRDNPALVAQLMQDDALKKIVDLPVDNGGNRALHFACASNNVAVAALVNHASCNVVNARGETPLLVLCCCVATLGNQVVTSAGLLLDQGANPNVADENGTTPLHYACLQWNSGLVKLLLEKGANPNARDSAGVTPLLATLAHHQSLRYATAQNMQTGEEKSHFGNNNNEAPFQPFEILETLVKIPGIDINAKDGFGRTVIHRCLLYLGTVDPNSRKRALALLEKLPETFDWKAVDVRGDTLAHACGAEMEVLRIVLEKYPEAVNVRNMLGQTPIVQLLARRGFLDLSPPYRPDPATLAVMHNSDPIGRSFAGGGGGFFGGNSCQEPSYVLPTRIHHELHALTWVCGWLPAASLSVHPEDWRQRFQGGGFVNDVSSSVALRTVVDLLVQKMSKEALNYADIAGYTVIHWLASFSDHSKLRKETVDKLAESIPRWRDLFSSDGLAPQHCFSMSPSLQGFGTFGQFFGGNSSSRRAAPSAPLKYVNLFASRLFAEDEDVLVQTKPFGHTCLHMILRGTSNRSLVMPIHKRIVKLCMNVPDAQGDYPIHFLAAEPAINVQPSAVLIQFLQAGADPHVLDARKRHIAHLAASTNLTMTLFRLMSAGVLRADNWQQWGSPDSEGRTPLHYLSMSQLLRGLLPNPLSQMHLFRMIMQLAPSDELHRKDRHGRSPLDYCAPGLVPLLTSSPLPPLPSVVSPGDGSEICPHAWICLTEDAQRIQTLWKNIEVPHRCETCRLPLGRTYITNLESASCVHPKCNANVLLSVREDRKLNCMSCRHVMDSSVTDRIIPLNVHRPLPVAEPEMAAIEAARKAGGIISECSIMDAFARNMHLGSLSLVQRSGQSFPGDSDRSWIAPLQWTKSHNPQGGFNFGNQNVATVPRSSLTRKAERIRVKYTLAVGNTMTERVERAAQRRQQQQQQEDPAPFGGDGGGGLFGGGGGGGGGLFGGGGGGGGGLFGGGGGGGGGGGLFGGGGGGGGGLFAGGGGGVINQNQINQIIQQATAHEWH